jgi:membrane protein
MRGVRLLQQLPWPGAAGVSLWDVSVGVAEGVGHPNFMVRASAIGYSLMLSFFPAVILAFTLLSYLPTDRLRELLSNWVLQSLPPATQPIVEAALMTTLQGRSTGLLILALLSVLYFSVQAFTTLLLAFHRDQLDLYRRRNFLQRYASALVLFGALFGLVLLSLLITLSGRWGLMWLADVWPWFGQFSGPIQSVLLRTVSLGLLLTGVSTLYYLGPALIKRWRFFSAGSMLATGLLFLAEMGLKYYFTAFASYDQIYGSLAALIILMLWFFYISVVILMGYELNVALYAARQRVQAAQQMAEIRIRS